MKKFLIIVIVSVLAGIYSPSIVKSWTTSAILVRDRVNYHPIGGAVVDLFYQNEAVFNGETDLNGIVDIQPVFYYSNSLYLDYLVHKDGYESLQGAKTFSVEEWTVLDLKSVPQPPTGRRGKQQVSP